MTTKKIYQVTIQVKTRYEKQQSNPAGPYYFFSYHIDIYNQDTVSIQLLSRYWEISDAGSETQIVKGEGVIGKRPVIHPGNSYSYQSFCHLRSPFGKMVGHYTFLNTENDTEFDLAVPELHFAYPIAMN